MKKSIITCFIILLLGNTLGFSQGSIVDLSNGKMFADACGETIPYSSENIDYSIAKDGSFVIKVKNQYGYRVTFPLSINEDDDYTIDAYISILRSQPPLTGYSNPKDLVGMIIGCKDWDNYSKIAITDHGGFRFSSRVNGVWITHASEHHLSCFKRRNINHIKLWKHGDKFILAMNGIHIATVDAFRLSDQTFGLYAVGKGKYCLHHFKITSEIQKKQNSTTNSSDQMQIVGSGTGFAIDKRGYFVTNHHVIEDAGAIGICIQKDGEWVSYRGKVIKSDPTNDIAIIKIDDDDFEGFSDIPYSFSYESEEIAADIFTLGYPRVDVMGTDIKYTTGVINSRTGIQGDPTHYQISAHIDHGNSGGPLFNAKGQIIGITDSGLDKAEFGDVNYSVKSMYIKALVESLPMKLQLPNDSRITTMSRSEQIKTISPYVALILIAQ